MAIYAPAGGSGLTVRAPQRWNFRVGGHLDGLGAGDLTGCSADHLPVGATRFSGGFSDQSEMAECLVRFSGLGMKFLIIRRDDRTGEPDG